jgi:hypothetical protein
MPCGFERSLRATSLQPEPVRRADLITRHGKAVAALVAAEDLDTLERLRPAGPEGGLASIAEHVRRLGPKQFAQILHGIDVVLGR